MSSYMSESRSVGTDVVGVINEELVRLHATMKLLIEYPDRIIGDLLHSDIHDDMVKLHNALISIAKKEDLSDEGDRDEDV
jgi:hypothetical protein